jgi:phosphatidate cytidylyltransferase
LNNFFQRLFTGIGYIALMIGLILAGKYFYGILFLIITVLTLYEFYRLFDGTSYAVAKISGLAAGGLIFIISFLFFSGLAAITIGSLVILLVLFLFIAEIYGKKENPFLSLSVMILGLFYVAVPFSLSAFLVFPQSDRQYTSGILLGLLILIWLYDTGAYVFGMLLGRHRLFERISPKKSWEGAIGGTVVTIVLGYWMDFFVPSLTRIDWLVFSLLVSVLGVYGDLFESFLKRKAGVKDSGNLMPGHGGILDRMDSILFIIPASVAYLMLKTVFF